MDTPATRRRRFRELLSASEIVCLPGAHNPLVARLVENAGFDAVYMPGSGTAANMLAVPDVGWPTMSEMVRSAHDIASRVRVPVIADADTGYGNAVSVVRTVREFESAGVAGIHIEDQTFPKRCGHFEGKFVISREEMVGKIRAALESREDSNFTIIARCDALAVESVDDALRRGEAYASAGADALWFDSLRSIELSVRIAEHFRSIPLVFNMSSSGLVPFLTAQELEQLGYKFVLWPIYTTLVAIRSMVEVLADLKEFGDVTRVLPRGVSFDEFNRLLGINEVHEWESKYGTATVVGAESPTTAASREA